MNVRFVGRLGVPTERTARELDFNVKAFPQRFPNGGDLLALRDRVRRNERRSRRGAPFALESRQFRGLKIPTGDVIDLSRRLVRLAALVDVNASQVFFLLPRLVRVTDERRIADNERKSVRGRQFPPIEPKRVPLDDVRVPLQREKFEFDLQDVLRFPQHLRFGDPKGRLRDGDGKIVDLDPVKLPDGNLNDVGDVQKRFLVVGRS